MVILVVYCLRNVHITLPPHGIPAFSAALLVVLLQVWRKNMYLSIVAGTVCYMLLIRVMV
jgi:branched-subunit amino acid transport protein AzlD